MKSKAELVVELDKMTKVRDELTQEVLNLSAQLEQERSKVNQLTLDIKRTHVSMRKIYRKLVISYLSIKCIKQIIQNAYYCRILLC